MDAEWTRENKNIQIFVFCCAATHSFNRTKLYLRIFSNDIQYYTWHKITNINFKCNLLLSLARACAPFFLRSHEHCGSVALAILETVCFEANESKELSLLSYAHTKDSPDRSVLRFTKLPARFSCSGSIVIQIRKFRVCVIDDHLNDKTIGILLLYLLVCARLLCIGNVCRLVWYAWTTKETAQNASHIWFMEWGATQRCLETIGNPFWIASETKLTLFRGAFYWPQ